jgi:LysM repeat protein
VIGKGAGAAALSYAGQALAAKANAATTHTGPDIPGANPHQLDPSQLQQPPATNIPGANPHQLDPSQFQPSPTDLPPAASDIVKTVAKGDTLSNIAQQNQTSVEVLMRANPQITNPDALAIGTQVHIPPTNATTYLHGAGTASDTAAKTASGAYDSVPKALGKQVAATRGAWTESIWKDNNTIRNKKIVESISFKKLSAYDLIDKKTTALNWALNESIGNKTRNVNLTTLGVYTIFENVDRYRLAVMEADNLMSADELERIRKGENPRASTPTPAAPASSTPTPAAPASSTPTPAAPASSTPAPAAAKAARAPGSSRPEQYAPHQPGGKGKQSKPGIIGRGLNWLDKTAGKVGNAISNFGHQFTTNVTKEKLNMNWTQAGQPSDSDQLAAFMKKQGVPEEVISTVYTKMGLPFTMSPAVAAADTDASTDAGSTGGADASASGAGAGAFGNMANQLSGTNNSTSSTGGTTSKTAQGLVHRAGDAGTTGANNAGGTVNSFTGSVNSYKNAGQSSFQPQASGGSASSTGNTAQQSQQSQQGQQSQQSQQQQTEPNTPREQQAVARTVRQQIDDVMHTVMTQHNDDQPALVKYLRQRLDSSFPPEVAATATPKATATKKPAARKKKPDNTIAMPKKAEKFRVGKDVITPDNPMYDKIKAASGANESTVPVKKSAILEGLRG